MFLAFFICCVMFRNLFLTVAVMALFFFLLSAFFFVEQVSMTWSEVWHEGLEEASRMYFGDDNVEGMLNRLQVKTTPLFCLYVCC